jgi:outer membrane biosynthesis protein TonB
MHRRRDICVLAISVAFHVVGVWALGRANAGHDGRRAPTEITLEVAPPKPIAEETPAPTPRAPVETPRVRARVVARVNPAAAPPPPAAASQPPAEEPIDLTGVTLTDGANGPGWSSAVGNGQVTRGPLGPAPAPRNAHGAGGGTAPVSDGERLVNAADLKRPPTPPELQAELERQYPDDARRAGLTGEARMHARVRPDGAVDRIRLVTATLPSFGDACRRVLGPSRWTPPMDRDGNSCATEVTYVCRFEVTR